VKVEVRPDAAHVGGQTAASWRPAWSADAEAGEVVVQVVSLEGPSGIPAEMQRSVR
jgi:hypothetical protein